MSILYCWQFLCSTPVEHLELNRKVEYTTTNQYIIHESNTICFYCLNSDENYLNDIFQDQVPSFLILLFIRPSEYHIPQCQLRLQAREMKLLIS
jgi:hypothetical protein